MSSSNKSVSATANTGTGLMGVIWFFSGAICSWLINHSLFWAIVHGIFGFWYILYLCLGCGGGLEIPEAALRNLLG